MTISFSRNFSLVIDNTLFLSIFQFVRIQRRILWYVGLWLIAVYPMIWAESVCFVEKSHANPNKNNTQPKINVKRVATMIAVVPIYFSTVTEL